MAKQNRKLEPTVILCFNLIYPEGGAPLAAEEAAPLAEDIIHIRDRFDSLIDKVLDGIENGRDNILKAKDGMFTMFFPSDEIVSSLIKAIDIANEIKTLWLNSSVNLSRKKEKKELIFLAIAIHQAAFPGGKPGGFGLECGIVLWNLASKESERDKNIKILISRDVYDVLEAASKLDPELNFVSLGLQKFEDIPPMTVYEINKKNAQEEKKEALIKIFLEAAPQFSGFVGREAELRKLQSSIETNNIAMVCGLPGIGKTALCSRLAAIIQDTYKIFWLTLHEDITEEMIFVYLDAFLAEKEDETLKMSQLGTEERIQALINSMEKNKYALFFDMERYTVKDDQIKTILSAIDKKLKKSIAIFIVPRKIEFLERASIEPIMLGELTREEIAQFLEVFGQENIPEKVKNEIIEKIGGNPSILKYFTSLIERYWYDPEELANQLPRYREDAEKYVIERLFSEASLEEKNLLFLLSMLRKPIDTTMAKAIYKLSDFEERINSVLKFFVFTMYPDNRYIAHPITKKMALTQERDVKRIHQQIGDCFNNLLNTKNVEKDIHAYLETFYHYFECGWTNEAFEIISNNLEILIESGYPKTMEQLFNKYTISILKPENWVNLWQCRGIIAEFMGDFGRAQEFYSEMLSYAEKIMFHAGRIHAWMLLARNSLAMGKATEAIETLNKACQLAERIENKDLIHEVYQKLSEYYLNTGDKKTAEEWDDKVEQLIIKKDETEKEWIY
ncbi:ATP-binding protein [Candidatus Desantisbacteria bacterium]|nr:ATP-binding protein [Candidatus Desantisbacteria bacterium]